MALTISLSGEQALCEPCEFNFSEKEEDGQSDKWWQAQYNKRLALANMLKGNYAEASNYYSHAIELNQENENSSIKSSCSYGYVLELVGNSDEAKQKINECINWVENNHLSIEGSYDVYETVWPLYLYHNKTNSVEAVKYLRLAYDYIDTDKINAYKSSTNKQKMGPKFFYFRDVIETYENSSIQ